MKALVLGAVGVCCITAAGIGGFVAQRLDGAPAADATPSTLVRVDAAADETVQPPEPVATEIVPAAPARVARPAAAPPSQPRPAAPAPRRVAEEPVVAPAPVPDVEPEPEIQLPPALDVSLEPAGLPPVSTADPVPAMPLPPMREPAPARFIELTLERDAVIGVRLDTEVSSSDARLEDRVVAIVSRDVLVGDRVAIPAGTRIEGDVVVVDQGGRFRERARIGIRFGRVMLTDETTVRIQSDPIFRDGESPTGEATSKIGASAVIGAILGGVIGGKKGAAIGGTAGAAGGTAAVAAGGPNAAAIAEGAALTLRLAEPVTLLVERERPRR